MNIIVATTHFPFIYGGAEVHARNIVTQLKKYGHSAELVQIPCNFKNAEEALKQIEICKNIDLSYFGGINVDKVIFLKYPVYFANHQDSTLWLLHQQRELYDLWNQFKKDSHIHKIDEEVRSLLIQEDQEALAKFKKRYTNSANVSKRLLNYSNLESQPIYHPPQDEEKFNYQPHEEYIYMPGRISPLKRHKLVLQALKKSKSKIKLVISGGADLPQYLDDLNREIERLNLKDQVIQKGHVTRNEMIELYSKSKAVIFTPVDEDYGYVTLEAMLSKKPVITCTDSGGPLEFIRHGFSGFISEPTPENLADCLNSLDNNEAIRTLGENAFNSYQKKVSNWEELIQLVTN